MKIRVISYSAQGGETAELLKSMTQKMGVRCEAYLYHKYRRKGLIPFRDIGPLVEEAFLHGYSLIFVCAAGIAVRKIAPFLRSKQTDPPVIVVDEMGKYVIPILSGHIGGANTLAEICASFLGAKAVITTATDIRGVFSPDIFAVQNGLYIENINEAKEIAAALLDGHEVGICLEKSMVQLPLIPEGLKEDKSISCYGIQVTPFTEGEPYDHTLVLVPRVLTLGIGCRKGTSWEKIQLAVEEVLEENHLHPKAVRQVCSIDLKKNEDGLVTFCKEWDLPFHTFSAAELQELPGEFSTSEFVRQVTSVDNICERSAVRGCRGRLIVRKTICDGVTVAVAAETAYLFAGKYGKLRKGQVIARTWDSQVLLFGGTTEGRKLAEHLNQEQILSTVCVATEYGQEVLPDLPYCHVLPGRQNAEEMEEMMRAESPLLVMDATHPYAAEVTKNIRQAAQHLGIPYVRIVREKDEQIPGALYFRNLQELTTYLNEHPGNAFVTTGSKELETFTAVKGYRDRLYVRVLPSEHVLEKCRRLGFAGRHLVGVQGPFSVEENVQALKDSQAKYFITKSTGSTGGFPEKAEAAAQTGAVLLVLERPAEEAGMTLEEARIYLTKEGKRCGES